LARTYRHLTDGYIETVFDQAEGEPRLIFDSEVRGLQCRVGKRRVTFAFMQEHSIRKHRSTSYERIGLWPAMDVKSARKAALQVAGRIAAGYLKPGKREAATLNQAWSEYLEHLKAQAARRGKPAIWARTSNSMVQIHLLPIFGTWSLAELAAAPAAVRDWHAKVEHPVSANRCASLLSAAYRYAAKIDRSLPPFNPISAVRMNKEEPAQSAMPFSDFPAWRAVVDLLPPLHAAFYRFVLLTGMRSGEASRLRWSDVSAKSRSITLPKAKARADIVVPMSAAIARELVRARNVGVKGPLIFPGAKKWNDDLSAKGHALRHTFRSVAADLGPRIVGPGHLSVDGSL
jgi:integrase